MIFCLLFFVPVIYSISSAKGNDEIKHHGGTARRSDERIWCLLEELTFFKGKPRMIIKNPEGNWLQEIFIDFTLIGSLQ